MDAVEGVRRSPGQARPSQRPDAGARRPSRPPAGRHREQTDVLDIPRPRREEYTICTAVAPAAVFTVRTYGDKMPHSTSPISAQIRSPRSANRRSASCTRSRPLSMSQVRKSSSSGPARRFRTKPPKDLDPQVLTIALRGRPGRQAHTGADARRSPAIAHRSGHSDSAWIPAQADAHCGMRGPITLIVTNRDHGARACHLSRPTHHQTHQPRPDQHDLSDPHLGGAGTLSRGCRGCR
jgi:hypothetical protein